MLRGEDLLSSTPRQIALYHALIEIGLCDEIPQFGHLPYVMGEGNKKLSKRDPQSNLLLHRERGFIPEGLLNYLSLLGWSIAPDRDVFTVAEMVEKFEVTAVNPNPARFDQKKADAINADHIRMLDAGDFADRITPYLIAAGVLTPQPSADQLRVLAAAAPLVQSRITVLSEAVGMLGFLFMRADQVSYDDDALKTLADNAAQVVSQSRERLALLQDSEWQGEQIQEVLKGLLVSDLGLKPRFAFAPLRVAVSGRRVSPPLFESLEILGKQESLVRLDRFVEHLAAA